MAASGAVVALGVGVTGSVLHEHEVGVWSGEFSNSGQATAGRPCYWQSGGPAGGGSCASDYNAISGDTSLEIAGYAAAGAFAVTSGVLLWMSRSSPPDQASLACGGSPLGGLGLSCAGRF